MYPNRLHQSRNKILSTKFTENSWEHPAALLFPSASASWNKSRAIGAGGIGDALVVENPSSGTRAPRHHMSRESMFLGKCHNAIRNWDPLPLLSMTPLSSVFTVAHMRGLL